MKELILSKACFDGIENTQTRQQIITPKHEQLVKQANERIKNRQRVDLVLYASHYPFHH